MLAIRAVFAWKVRRTGHSSWSAGKEAVQREGWWSLLLRPIAFLCMLALMVYYAVSPAGSSPLAIALPAWLRWVGVVLATVSLPLLVWVHQALREYWSTVLQLRSSHALITAGPYAWVRHPMYTALLLNFTGLALASAVWPFMVLVVIMTLFFHRVAGREEAMMTERFGDKYRGYVQRTGRFLPCFRRPARVR